MKWSHLPLEQFVDFNNGKSIKPSEKGIFPAFGSNGIIGYSDNYLYDKGIIIGRVGANCGSVEISLNNFWPSDNTIVVKPKPNADLVFVYYLLKNYPLNSYAGGSAQPLLTQNVLKPIKFKIPDFPIQRRIASILSAYDDLIENNLKRIKLLEEKAFLRYKQIVSTEKMVSENKLEDIIQTVKRKPKVLKSDYKEVGEFPIIDQSTDFIGGYTNEKDTIYEEIPMIVFGDHTRILKYINFPFACGADGTQLIKPKDTSICVAYLYFELISCNLSNYHYARHFKFLKEQIIKLPSENVMKAYQVETNNIFNLIQVLRLQNTKLREARDILLPKLISGQIEVYNFN